MTSPDGQCRARISPDTVETPQEEFVTRPPPAPRFSSAPRLYIQTSRLLLHHYSSWVWMMHWSHVWIPSKPLSWRLGTRMWSATSGTTLGSFRMITKPQNVLGRKLVSSRVSRSNFQTKITKIEGRSFSDSSSNLCSVTSHQILTSFCEYG